MAINYLQEFWNEVSESHILINQYILSMFLRYQDKAKIIKYF